MGTSPSKTLSEGDIVLTADGAAEPIRWIGRRDYDGRFIAGNHLMLPVTFLADSIGEGVPDSDLHVSPGHGMFIDGQIVPAWRLINGGTIRQARAVDSVRYYHVELHRHAILFANGAPTESFLDETGFREQFHNCAAFCAKFADQVIFQPLRARLDDGFALQLLQDRLAERGGVVPQVEPIGTLRGFVDQARSDRLCGWAQDLHSPEEPVTLEVLVDDQPVLCILANAYRADLRQAGMGSGCHAFDVALPADMPGTITVRRVADGTLLRSTLVVDSGRAAA